VLRVHGCTLCSGANIQPQTYTNRTGIQVVRQNTWIQVSRQKSLSMSTCMRSWSV
jgi:hypothetical protein